MSSSLVLLSLDADLRDGDKVSSGQQGHQGGMRSTRTQPQQTREVPVDKNGSLHTTDRTLHQASVLTALFNKQNQ